MVEGQLKEVNSDDGSRQVWKVQWSLRLLVQCQKLDDGIQAQLSDDIDRSVQGMDQRLN